MGTDNRQRGNKNLLIITNSAIIGAVEKKAITPIGSFRGMTLFDMNDGIVLARLKDKTGFITGIEDIHRIIGIEPCVQKYGTPKGNERQGYRYVFCENNKINSLGLRIKKNYIVFIWPKETNKFRFVGSLYWIILVFRFKEQKNGKQ